jgi:hypothetical protein
MDQTLVEIIVGGEDAQKSFNLHKDLLCYHSRYFRKAFEGDWQENEDKFIRLPDVSETTFRLFQHWLYAQVTRESECSPARKIKANLPLIQKEGKRVSSESRNQTARGVPKKPTAASAKNSLGLSPSGEPAQHPMHNQG